MKSIKNLFLTLFISASLVGCNDLLDLKPQASISDDVALSTPGNVQTALVGGYASLASPNAWAGSYVYLLDIYAANVNELYFNGTFIQPREVNTKAILKTNSFISGYWATSYNIINRANNILAALDVFGSDTATRNKVEAEAKFLRAVAYYHLVVAFGKAYNDGTPSSNPGVPLVLTPTRVVDETLQVPRNTVEQVYTQVIADLNAAKAALPEGNGFYANTYTASAMLARVYLTKGDFANAATEANRVIASNKYSLFANVSDNYLRTSNGSETIYAVQNTATNFNNDMTVFYAPLSYGRADIQVLNPHLTNYESGDKRAALFVTTGRGRMTTKYGSTDAAVDGRRRNITILRLAEMYLIRAEANFRRTGNNAGTGSVTPLADLNRIRVRAGLAEKASVTLDDILKERRNELMFEGLLFTDLKRLQGTTASLTRASIPWNDNALVFPIPEREMLVNAQLTQNPGY